MSKSGIEFVFAAFAIILTVGIFTGAFNPCPRLCLALMIISLSSLSAAGIYSRFFLDKNRQSSLLIINLLLSFGFFNGGITGAIYPRDGYVTTPYFSGAFALAAAVYAGYSIRQYIKKTRP